MIWGAAHVSVGLSVRRHKAWARLLALMFGSVDLLLLPYGTALGVYALWVLLNEEGKALFRVNSRLKNLQIDYELNLQSLNLSNLQFHGWSTVPIGVQGPHRAIRLIGPPAASHDAVPAITLSA